MKLIDEIKLKHLLIDSEKLRRLEILGVDNWSGYDFAIWGTYEDFDKSLEDWEDEDLPNILEKYQDSSDSYVITFTEPFYKNYLEYKINNCY